MLQCDGHFERGVRLFLNPEVGNEPPLGSQHAAGQLVFVFVRQYVGQEDDAVVVLLLIVYVGVGHLQRGLVAVEFLDNGVLGGLLSDLVADDIPLAVGAAGAGNPSIAGTTLGLLVARPGDDVLLVPLVEHDVDTEGTGKGVYRDLFLLKGKGVAVVRTAVRVYLSDSGIVNRCRVEVGTAIIAIEPDRSGGLDIHQPVVIGCYREIIEIQGGGGIPGIIRRVTDKISACLVFLPGV